MSGLSSLPPKMLPAAISMTAAEARQQGWETGPRGSSAAQAARATWCELLGHVGAAQPTKAHVPLLDSRPGALTVKQVLAAILEQAGDAERDEELGAQRVPVQVAGQRKGALQHRDQQEAA